MQYLKQKPVENIQHILLLPIHLKLIDYKVCRENKLQ